MRTHAPPSEVVGPYVNTAAMLNKPEIITPDDIEKNSISRTVEMANLIYNKQSVSYGQKHKIAVCCCGIASDSLKYTYVSIKENIIEILSKEFSVDVFVHETRGSDVAEDKTSELLEARLIDGIDGTGLIKTYISTDSVNTGIDRIRKKALGIQTTGSSAGDEPSYGNNFMRELYMEYDSYKIVTEYQRKNNIDYNAIVYVWPDMFITKPIAISEVHKVISNPKAIYCSSFNDWDGYGVGYYIGSTKSLDIITSRINNLPANKISSEKHLKLVIDSAKLKRYKSTIFYFKIHSSGSVDVYYQLLKKYTTPTQYMDAKKAYQLATSTNPKNKVRNDTAPCATDDLSIRPRLSQLRKHKRRSCPH